MNFIEKMRPIGGGPKFALSVLMRGQPLKELRSGKVVLDILGVTSSWRLTAYEPSLPSLISSCSGAKGSFTDGPNTSSTMAYTLPLLKCKNNNLKSMNHRFTCTAIQK